MKNPNFLKKKPIRIAIYYVGCLILTMVLSFFIIGSENITESAMSSKPYTVLVQEYYFFGLLSEYHEKTEVPETDRKKIIFFGDSNDFYPPDTVVPRNNNSSLHVSTLIRDSICANAPCSDLHISNWSYIGATMFDRYCLFYQARKYMPDLLIVSVNWISFGAPWQNDRSYFRPELSALVPLFSGLPADYSNPVALAGISPLEQLKYRATIYSFYPVGAKIWIKDNLKMMLDSNATGTIFPPPSDDLEPEEIARPNTQEDEIALNRNFSLAPPPKVISLHYPMRIKESHPVLGSLRALSYVASRRNIRVLFFLWPADIEYFKELGIFEEEEFNKSRAMIAECAQEEGVLFVDLVDILAHDDFYDWRGHYTVEGRKKIAEALAPTVLNMLE